MARGIDLCEPNTYVDAQGIPKWEIVVIVEIDSLKKNRTWELVPRTQGNNVVKC